MDMNYIGGIAKILEMPKQSFLDNDIIITKVRVQLPQLRNTQVVKLTFWGNLASDVNNFYKTNDYVIIEGYISYKNELQSRVPKQIEITVLKIYPFLLNS